MAIRAKRVMGAAIRSGLCGLAMAVAGGFVGTPLGQAAPTNADIVKGADWKGMQTVKVEIKEHSYGPKELVFEVGKAYKLELRNVGEKPHYFTAPEFYKAIATRKIEAAKVGEIKVPYIDALEMMPNGGQLDLYFVPVTKGTYEVFCTIEDHRQQGMEGKITIK
ncbi:MAG: cupredoxin domain-containing protein [Magnetococcales bacterium]|nr:cupredoxin domain-containing protein [Magnetococcales bacterium]